MEYKTELYNAGSDLGEAIRKEKAKGWAVHTILENPNRKYNSTECEFIVTYVKAEKQYETK